MNHDAHVHAYQNECLRRCLIRQLLRWRAERGDNWMRGFVADWKRWPGPSLMTELSGQTP